jgi:high-affinity nickel-transport protein
MTAFGLPLEGMAMFFLLGLRHGVEPDHIAAIDSLTLRAHDIGHKHAPWTGALFAVGHGLAVGLIALLVSFAARRVSVPAGLADIVDWVPTVLLAAFGLYNVKVLMSPGLYRPDSLRMRLVPRALRDRTDIWSTVATGLVFATVVDSLGHVSAWSVFASQTGTWWAGLAAGLLFSIGMLAASTADSQLLTRVLSRNLSPDANSRIRRGIGWGLVVLSFGLVAQAIVAKWP